MPPTIRWMPVIGQFEFKEKDNRVVFKGGSSPNVSEPDKPPVAFAGIALTDQVMVNGSLEATVSFDGEITGASVCEIVFGHDSRTRGQVTAGLGGSGAMYSVRQWVTNASLGSSGALPPRGTWKDLRLDGDRGNLRSKTPYQLVVRVDGSNIRLDVNGVRVIETTLPEAISEPRQVGVFCLGHTDVTISRFAAAVEQPRVFIVTQFSSPYNEVYSHVIKAVCQELKLTALRADELYGPEIIIKDVVDNITKSQIVIADISPTNPNVYFEVGYALALGKPIVLLAQRRSADSPLPFDVSAFRVLFYDDTIGGKPKLEEGLRNHLREILGRA
ncbi:MAG TPA: hypothetical protein VGF24_01690 [Vicinamibacterales bacterium]|jgi:hypothetical protein